MEIIENKGICKINKIEYTTGKIIEEFVNCSFSDILDLNSILKTISSLNNNLSNRDLRKKEKIVEEISKNVPSILQTPVEELIYIYVSFLINGTNTNPKSKALEIGIDRLKKLQKKYNKRVNIVFNNDTSEFNNIDEISKFLFEKEYSLNTSYCLTNITTLDYESHIEINDIETLLFYDFLKCINNKNSIYFKKCPICDRLFVTTKSNTVYCDNSSCKRKGKNYAYLEKTKNDDYVQAYKKAYKRVHKQYLSIPSTPKRKVKFDNWKKKAKEMLNNLKNGKIVEDEFYNYLKKENDPYRKK